MARTVHLFHTLSHKYRDSRMNPSEYVTTAKALAPTRIVEPLDYDDGGSITFRVVAQSKDRKRNLSQAIRESYTYGGCSHDYDCCGCSHSYAAVTRLNARNYLVRVKSYYNF